MICVNFDNPIEKRQFLEMESVFGKNTSEWLWHVNNGHPLDKKRNGEDSMLFKEINDIVGNRLTSMLLKAQIYTEGFEREPTLKEFFDRVTPKEQLVSHSVRPKELTYKEVRRAMLEEITEKMITGGRIKRGDHLNEVRFEFGKSDVTYSVAKEKAMKINRQFGEGTATLDTRNPQSITMFINLSDKHIIRQLAQEVEVAKQKEDERNLDDILTRQIEGNWKVNDEGDVVSLDEYDFSDYLPLGTTYPPITTTTISFPNTMDTFLDEKEKRIKELKNVQQRLRKELKYSKGNPQIAGKIQDINKRLRDLRNEVYNIRKNGAFSVLFGGIVQKDFARVEELLKNNDGDSLVEAKRIIDYYAAADNKDETNPFFALTGISINDAPQDIRQTLALIASDARTLETEYKKKLQAVAFDTLTSHPNYAKLYPNGITMEEVFADVHDIGFLSEYFLSVDFTFSGVDSILAQVIKELFERKLLGKIAVAKGLIEDIDAQLAKVNTWLIEHGEYRNSFLGALTFHKKVPLYSIFYQKNDLGHIMPALIDKLSSDWFSFVNSIDKKVDEAWKKGLSVDEVNSVKYKEIHKNARLLDFVKLPSLFSIHDAFAGLNVPWVSAADEQAYKNELIAEMGKSKFDDFVEQQVSKLDEFAAYKHKIISDKIAEEGVANFSGLSQATKDAINKDIIARSPLLAFKADANGVLVSKTANVTCNTTLEYNTYIPLKGAANMYNGDFAVIESNPVLLNFYRTLREAARNINESVPFKAKYATSILSMNMGILEAVVDKRIGQKRQLASLAGIKNVTRTSLANFFSSGNNDFDEDLLKKENDQTKVSDAKFKSVEERIEKRLDLELKEISQILNLKLNNTTMVDLNTAKPEMIQYLGKLFGVRPSIAEIAAKTGGNTDLYITRVVRTEVGRQEMLKESLNLPKVLKYYLAQAAHYDAANEIIPMLSGLKNLYNAIKGTDGGNRKRAEKRMNEWFDRVIRGYRVREGAQKGIRVYTAEDKERKERLEKLLKSATSQQEKDEYTKEIAELGNVVNVNSIWNVINSLIVWNGLTYNIRSSVFNYTYGYLQSLYVDQLGDYWTPGNFNAAFNFVLGKGRKNLGRLGGWAVSNWREHAEEIAKAEMFVNKTYIIQDMRNEKQKASTNLGKKELSSGIGNLVKPYYLSVTAVEWRNQTADILSVLMDTEIEDRDGNKVKMFDGKRFTCYNNVDGKLILKDEFRYHADGSEMTENIENWEKMNGDKFKSFHMLTTSAIRAAQGDYSPTGGMLAKSSQAGKTVMIFNTWLPMMLWTRFGKGKQLSTGAVKERAIYERQNPMTLAISVGALTTAAIATTPLTIAAAAGGVLVAASLVRAFANNISVKGEVNYVTEMIITLKAIAMKTAGLPINLMLRLLPANIGTTKEILKPGLKGMYKTEQDARAMQFILMEIAVMLNLIMMKMAAVWALSCDEETPSCERRTKIKNFLDNSFTRIIRDTVLYLSPMALVKAIKDGAFFRYLDKYEGFLPALDKFMNGEDIIEGGEYDGESRMLRLVDKTLIPSVLSINHASPLFDSDIRKKIGADPYSLFDVAMPHQRDYTPKDIFDRSFASDRQKAETNIGEMRDTAKKKLRKLGYDEKYIQRAVDKDFPTLAQKAQQLERAIKKGDMTRAIAEQSMYNYIQQNK